MSRRWVTCLARTRSAVSIAQVTAARTGPKFSIKMKTPAGLISLWILPILMSSLLRCGRRDARHGAWTVAGQEVGCFDSPKVAPHGMSFMGQDCMEDILVMLV